MEQVRNTQTEARIRQAITALLPQKGLAGMTVSDVCREAGINRGTFYLHYEDKYDLYEKQCDAVFAELEAILLAPGADPGEADIVPRDRIEAALAYVRGNYALVAALTENGTSVELQERMKGVLGELIERSAREHGLSLSFGGVPHDYGREMLLGGVTAVIWLWLRKGCVEEPAQIADIIWTNKSSSPEELLA